MFRVLIELSNFQKLDRLPYLIAILFSVIGSRGIAAGPPVPRNLIITSVTATSFEAKWDSGGTGTVSYKYGYAAGTIIPACSTALPLSTQSITVISLTPNTQYIFAVCAVNSAGLRSMVSAKSVTTLGPPPSTPVDLSLTPSLNSFTAKWRSGGTGTVGFKYGFASGSNTPTCSSVSTQPFAIVYSLTAGTRYTFAVCSYNSVGTLSSPLISSTTVGPPASVVSAVVATPTFIPPAGTYNATQYVQIVSAGATIYYTTDGSTPSTSSSSAVNVARVSILKSQTLKAIAMISGRQSSAVGTAAYTIGRPVAATPTFSPAGGNYTSEQRVTITSTPGTIISYTIDGSDPSAASSTIFGSAKSPASFTVTASKTLKAIARNSKMQDSAVGTAAYVINYPVLETPTFNPAGNTYTADQSVIISSASGSLIYYTTDGSPPSTTSSTTIQAESQATVPVSASKTLKAIAVKKGMQNSAVGTAAYVINYPVLKTPTFSPPPGPYDSDLSVTISSNPGATIFYTTDGSLPMSNPSTTFGAESPASVRIFASQTLNASAMKPGMQNSAVGTAKYVISPPPSAGKVKVSWDTLDQWVVVELEDAQTKLAPYEGRSYEVQLTLDGKVQPMLGVPPIELAYIAVYGSEVHLPQSQDYINALWNAHPNGVVPYAVEYRFYDTTDLGGSFKRPFSAQGNIQLKKREDNHEYKIAVVQVVSPGVDLTKKQICLSKETIRAGQGFVPIGNIVDDCEASHKTGSDAQDREVRSYRLMDLLMGESVYTPIDNISSDPYQFYPGNLNVYSLKGLGSFWEGMLAKHGITETTRFAKNPHFKLSFLPPIAEQDTLTSSDKGQVVQFFGQAVKKSGVQLDGYDFVVYIQYQNKDNPKFNRSFVNGKSAYCSVSLYSRHTFFNDIFLHIAHEMGHMLFGLPDRYDGQGIVFPTGIPDPQRFPQLNSCIMSQGFGWERDAAWPDMAKTYSTYDYFPKYASYGISRFQTEDPANQVLCVDDIIHIRGANPHCRSDDFHAGRCDQDCNSLNYLDCKGPSK